MRHFALFGSTLALTAALYVSLAIMGAATLDPVVMKSAPLNRPEYRQHGMPALNWNGIAAWCGVVAIYAVAVVLVCRIIVPARWRWPMVISVAVASLLFMAILHPLLVPLLLPPWLRRNYLWVFETIQLPFGPSQRFMDLRDLLIVGAIPHSVLTYVILTMRRSKRRTY